MGIIVRNAMFLWAPPSRHHERVGQVASCRGRASSAEKANETVLEVESCGVQELPDEFRGVLRTSSAWWEASPSPLSFGPKGKHCLPWMRMVQATRGWRSGFTSTRINRRRRCISCRWATNAPSRQTSTPAINRFVSSGRHERMSSRHEAGCICGACGVRSVT